MSLFINNDAAHSTRIHLPVQQCREPQAEDMTMAADARLAWAEERKRELRDKLLSPADSRKETMNPEDGRQHLNDSTSNDKLYSTLPKSRDILAATLSQRLMGCEENCGMKYVGQFK